MPTRLSSGGLAIRVAVALLLLISLAGVAISIDVHSATADGHASTTAGGSHSVATLESHTAVPADGSTGTDIVNFAAHENGIPYCDGGGGINGPSVGGSGSTCAQGVKGFDCMSLAQYAVYQATGFAIDANGDNLYGGPDYNSKDGSYIQSSSTVTEDKANLEPGEVVLFGGTSSFTYAHSGIWAGNDQIWDASGAKVQIVSFEDLMSTYNNDYQGAMDYNNLSGTNPPPLSISTTSLPNATIGKKYVGGQLTASGGTTPLKWTVSGLPRGLKVSSKKGLINGSVRSSKSKPQAPGKYPLTITVTDSSNPKQQASKSLNLTLVAAS
jgi:cell wall-associated NlpC family hydrolase